MGRSNRIIKINETLNIMKRVLFFIAACSFSDFVGQSQGQSLIYYYFLFLFGFFYISLICRQAADEPFGQESFRACSKNYHYLKVCLYAYLTLTVQALNPKDLLQVPSTIVRLISYRTNVKDSTHPTGHCHCRWIRQAHHKRIQQPRDRRQSRT